MCLPEQSARDAALAELARLDPAALDAASLMGQITDLAGFISQAQGQLARLAGTLDATGGAAEAGHGSAVAFLRTSCGLSPGHAAAVTTTARGLAGRAPIRTAVEAGVISFDQAQIILRATSGLDDSTAEAVEMVLLDHAPGLDTARLRQFAARGGLPGRPRRRRGAGEEAVGQAPPVVRPHAWITPGCCPARAATRSPTRSSGPRRRRSARPAGRLDARTAAQRRMDGLVAACKSALDGGRAPERHGSAPHISILVHDETLAQGGTGRWHQRPGRGGGSWRRRRAPQPRPGRAYRPGPLPGRRRARPGTARC